MYGWGARSESDGSAKSFKKLFLSGICGLSCLFALTPAGAAEPGMLASASNAYSVAVPNPPSTSAPVIRAVGNKVLNSPALKGWDYLFDLLVDEGLDPVYLRKIFADSRMPAREPLIFSLQPKESSDLYRRLNTARNRKHALAFYNRYATYFIRSEKEYHVPPGVVLALLQVETACGANTGGDRIFYRLARLASAATPDNIEENYFQKRNVFKSLTIEAVKSRGNILQEMFLRHAAATFGVAEGLGVHPLELRGSSAGALGIPQFLPGNVRDFGVDADRDGEINIFQPADAIMSVARYLSAHGWNNQQMMTTAKKREVIRYYNHSDPYISTLLAMSRTLEPEIKKANRTAS